MTLLDSRHTSAHVLVWSNPGNSPPSFLNAVPVLECLQSQHYLLKHQLLSLTRWLCNRDHVLGSARQPTQMLHITFAVQESLAVVEHQFLSSLRIASERHLPHSLSVNEMRLRPPKCDNISGEMISTLAVSLQQSVSRM